jgi:type IV secretion system protein VirD4
MQKGYGGILAVLGGGALLLFGLGQWLGSGWIMERVWHFPIALLLGGLVGAFFSDACRPIRKWLGIAFWSIVALVACTSNVIFGDVALFVIAFVAALFVFRAVSSGRGRRETTFGSAEWADLDHLLENDLTGKQGLRLGMYGGKYPLHYTGNRHLLTVAPTRSGKGVSAIIPNLLTYSGSALVIDPKGENAMITAKRREAMGQAVYVVDPWGITGLVTACFNPLDWLQAGDRDISENAMMLADSIITPREGKADPFWDEEAKALLMGLLLFVALDDGEAGNRHLGRVRDIINLHQKGFDAVLEKMAGHENPIVRSTAYRTASKEEKLLGSVLASLQSHTHFLDSPSMRASLAKSDFEFRDMKTSSMTIYLVLPADRLQTFGRWLRILVQQAITINARNLLIKPDKPILFMLDEMAALGRLTMVEQAFGLMAGFGMQLWGIVQDLGQLERIYGDSWETFIGNSGVLQYFGSRDLKTAEYFSKLCGVATIRKFSISQSIASSIGWNNGISMDNMNPDKGSSSMGRNESESHTHSVSSDTIQRHLAFPDELMVLRNDKQLVFIESYNPISAKKIRWYEDKEYQALGVSMEALRIGGTKPDMGVSLPVPVKQGLGLS